jgi:acetoin utilization deacetylase AcuC-like enzyme
MEKKIPIIFDSKALEFEGTLGNKERLNIAYNFLKHKVQFTEPEEYLKEPTVHSKELIESVKNLTFSNPDTPTYPNSFEHAMLSLNSAITAQKLQGFSFMEPPGHHAYKDSLGGFCYFNNLTEAVIQSKLKTLIIDIDGHHGNGTEDIVKNNPNIFFISLHRNPCYPGTGLESFNNIINKPLPPECGEEIFIKTLKDSIDEALTKFKPEQIAVSAGFDTFDGDLASLSLEKESYKKIAHILKQTAQKNNCKLFGVLEGGYSEILGELIFEFIEGLS